MSNVREWFNLVVPFSDVRVSGTVRGLKPHLYQNENSNNLFSKNNYMPNNICASPSLDKEKNLLRIGMDGDGKEKPRENNQLPTFKWAWNLPDM
ncbi:hypothetical protein [Bacillus sp. UNC41MFS5]|uniref:hypothetical protein n=1 Tax=Bacillus sp. UNC41MFS5 TaxID=1449046 RepID=UPI0018CC478B|nr:hypothetical protein [Bacillus sp. UNC41MFS5]